MEKKRNQIARGQSSSDFKKDVSNKQQFPKQQKRRESNNINNEKSQNKNRHHDKRPQHQRRNELSTNTTSSSSSSSSSTGLMDDAAELNSVFNHGSKKQNLNHLLNFHYYSAKDNSEAIRSGTFAKHGYHRSSHYSKRYNFNKEQYLQANCQFIVKADTGFDYRPFKICPDNLVGWNQVVKILVSSVEEAQCPICLYPPKAAKMTRCGHIYCSSCILHYLSLSDKTWRKCPICFESIHHPDLKSTSSKHNHRSYKVGDTISMELLKREKGSIFVVKSDENDIQDFPSMSCNIESSAKLIMADHEEILKIIQQEQNELEFQLIEDGVDCPESVFIQTAMELLKKRREEVENDMRRPKPKSSSSSSSAKVELNPKVAEFVPIIKQQENVNEIELCTEARNQLIEDSNLTVNDIDIAPEHLKHFYFYQASNAQNIFLHSINSRILQEMFTSLDKAPKKICGKILQIESCTMDETLRKRLKYLSHLPLASVFEVVEIEFERDFIPTHVVDKFRDELLHRRKMRQRREREEKKHEKSINEINDRQMGKFIKSVAEMNVNIDSIQQFPECGGFDEMPTLLSSLSTSPATSSAGPSFANMLTTPKSRKSEASWPSLSSSPATAATTSFFDEKKFVQITGTRNMKAQPTTSNDNIKSDEEDAEEESENFKTPAYHQLGDCLATALAKQMQYGVSKSGKKKKTKKTLLFASGMNFN